MSLLFTIGPIILIGMGLLNIFVAVWAYKDAEKRGYESWVGLLLVLGIICGSLLVAVVWLFIRKDKR